MWMTLLRSSRNTRRTRSTPGLPSVLAMCLLILALTERAVAQPIGSAARDIEIALENMGIEGSFRPGSYVPIRLEIRNRLDAPTPVQIVFEISNNDGDIEQYSRPALLSPGQSNRTWLYPVLPPRSSASELAGVPFTVRVYEDDEGAFGRELTSWKVDATGANRTGQPVEMTEDLLVIVGEGSLGLLAYEGMNNTKTPVPSLNQRSVVVNTSPQGLPDDPRGYVGVDAMIWADADPAELGLETARALRSWIERGGRLIIVLDENEDRWGLGGTARSALSDLLPDDPPTPWRNVEVRSVLPALSKSDMLRDPDARMGLRLFDGNALSPPWQPFAALPAARNFDGSLRTSTPGDPAGGLYAIQRRLGFGWIVLCGIDANAIQRRQLQPDGLPQADVFWNRLLGRRGALPTSMQLKAYDEAKQLRTASSTFNMGTGEMITEFSSLKIAGGTAGTWTLFVLILFIVYGVLACPISFYYLRRKGRVRYSWMAFAGFAVVFTVIALIASTMGRRIISSGAPVSHLTFLDVVDGDMTVRAQSWFSTYLGRYGTMEVMVEGRDNLLSTWSAPPNGSLDRFPNSDVFRIPNQTTNRLDIPSRGTSAHFTTLWSGELSGDWADMPNDAGGEIVQSVTSGEVDSFKLSGRIAHGLPWEFSRLRIIQISPFITALPRYVPFKNVSRELPMAPLPAPGTFSAVAPDQWRSGQGLDLEAFTGGRQNVRNGKNNGELSLSDELDRNFRDRLRKQNDLELMIPGENWRDHTEEILEMYAIYEMLPQRSFLLDESGVPNTAPGIHRRRWLARESDCSDWFLQPCVMVIGILEGVPSPVPIRIDGSPVESDGTVVLRWMHPLPVDGDLVRPSPRTLKSFQFPPQEVDESLTPGEDEPSWP